jgi:hypothetical protein
MAVPPFVAPVARPHSPADPKGTPMSTRLTPLPDADVLARYDSAALAELLGTRSGERTRALRAACARLRTASEESSQATSRLLAKLTGDAR